jgi:sugar phosphate permease
MSTKKAWMIFAIIAPVYVCTMFYRMAPTVLALDIAKDMSLSASDMSMLGAATMLGYGIMQLPSGLLSDWLGGKKTLTIFTVLVGLSTLWFGLSHSLTSVTAARFITGVGIAATIPCLSILARWFPATMYARVSGIMFAGGTCGTLIASTPLAVASNLWGWRPTILAFGVLSLVLASLVLFFVSDSPERARAASRPVKKEHTLFQGLKVVLSSRNFWLLCIMYSCVLLVYFGFAGLWWGPYLMQGCGLSKIEAGNILFLGTLLSVPAMPVLTAISDKIRSRKKVIIPCVAVILSVMSVMAFFPGSLSQPVLVLLAVLFTSACGMSALGLTSGKELFPLGIMGTATGCLNSFPPMLAAVSQKIFGYILESSAAYGAGDYSAAYMRAMIFNVALLAVAMLIAPFIKETYPKE